MPTTTENLRNALDYVNRTNWVRIINPEVEESLREELRHASVNPSYHLSARKQRFLARMHGILARDWSYTVAVPATPLYTNEDLERFSSRNFLRRYRKNPENTWFIKFANRYVRSH